MEEGKEMLMNLRPSGGDMGYDHGGGCTDIVKCGGKRGGKRRARNRGVCGRRGGM